MYHHIVSLTKPQTGRFSLSLALSEHVQNCISVMAPKTIGNGVSSFERKGLSDTPRGSLGPSPGSRKGRVSRQERRAEEPPQEVTPASSNERDRGEGRRGEATMCLENPTPCICFGARKVEPKLTCNARPRCSVLCLRECSSLVYCYVLLFTCVPSVSRSLANTCVPKTNHAAPTFKPSINSSSSSSISLTPICPTTGRAQRGWPPNKANVS